MADGGDALAFLDQTSVAAYLAEQHLKETPEDHKKKTQPLLLNTDMTVGEALREMAKIHVLSAPLVLKLGASYQALAFLSIADLVKAFVTSVRKQISGDLSRAEIIEILTKAGHDFALRGIMTVGSADDGDMVFSGALDSVPVAELIRGSMLRLPRAPGVPVRHRVGVFDDSGSIQDIISMSNLVDFAVAHKEQLRTLLEQPISELALVTDRLPICVSCTEPTIASLTANVNNLVSAVGVVDDASGVLVANLSESDMRSIKSEEFGLLALPVGEFLAQKFNLKAWTGPPPEHLPIPLGPPEPERVVPDAAQPAEGEPPSPSPPTPVDAFARALYYSGNLRNVSPGASLLQVMEIMAEHRVHRVYCVSPETGKPLGVITCSDVLATLVDPIRNKPKEVEVAAPAPAGKKPAAGGPGAAPAKGAAPPPAAAAAAKKK